MNRVRWQASHRTEAILNKDAIYEWRNRITIFSAFTVKLPDFCNTAWQR